MALLYDEVDCVLNRILYETLHFLGFVNKGNYYSQHIIDFRNIPLEPAYCKCGRLYHTNAIVKQCVVCTNYNNDSGGIQNSSTPFSESFTDGTTWTTSTRITEI